jgi:hypothetical protein
MKMNLSDFSLLKEDDGAYTIGHPKGKSMTIPKTGMSDKAHALISKLRKHQNFAEGTPDGTDSTESEPTLSADASGSDASQSVPAPDAPVDSVTVSIDPNAAPPGATPYVVPPTGMSASQESAMGVADQPVAPSNVAATYNTAPIEAAKKAEIAGAEAQSKAGQLESKAYADAAKSAQDLQVAFENRAKDYNAKGDALFKQATEGKVDPNRYWNNMSTGSKIASALGMMLSGIGAGLTHSPNLAVESLHRAIDADIDAQKNDQSKSMNLYKMNREALGDDRSATLATQSQLYQIAKVKAVQAQAAAQGDIAKARLAPVILGFDQQIQNTNRMRAMMDMSKDGSAAQMDPSMLVSTLVPQPHQAKVFGEISAAQNTKRMGNSIMKSFEDAVKENTVLRTGAGLLRTPGSVMALHQSMQPTFADLEGTVRQAAMDNTFTNITPMPGDTDHKVQQKREALTEYLKSKASAPTAKGFGIDLDKFESTKPGNHMYPPGSVVSVKGKQFQVGQDGDTLTPL